MSENQRRILVTNDDGIDSVALHELARAMQPLGNVFVVAPDREYSGFGAAIGDIWSRNPEAHDGYIDGVEEAYAISGPPALCVMYAHLGAFGPRPDMVVSGVNPGANLGRSVYYSGTVGAALSGRVHGIPGIAVSQELKISAEGQAWPDIVASVDWQPPVAVAAQAAAAMIDSGLVGRDGVPIDPTDVRVLNINTPAMPMTEMAGWHWSEIATKPRTAMATASLSPKPGFKGQYRVNVTFETPLERTEGTDTWAVDNGHVSLTWLSPLTALPPSDTSLTKLIDERLDGLVGQDLSS